MTENIEAEKSMKKKRQSTRRGDLENTKEGLKKGMQMAEEDEGKENTGNRKNNNKK